MLFFLKFGNISLLFNIFLDQSVLVARNVFESKASITSEFQSSLYFSTAEFQQLERTAKVILATPEDMTIKSAMILNSKQSFYFC